jgi:hypothetical protein
MMMAPFDRLPWEWARKQMGSKTTEFISEFARLIRFRERKLVLAQLVEIIRELDRLPRSDKESQPRAVSL